MAPILPRSPEPEAKPNAASKTMWVNTAIAVIATVFAGINWEAIAANPEYAAAPGALVATALINMILRQFTKVPVR